MNNDKYQRNINVYRILRTIWLSEGVSRIQMASMLNLDKSTVTNIVTNLIEQDLVRIKAEGEAGKQGGRKPLYLEINKNRASVAGVEIQADLNHFVIINLHGEIIFEEKIKRTVSSANFKEVFFDIYNKLLKETEAMGIELLGIGLGLAGVINPDDAIIYNSITLNFEKHYDLYKEIFQEIDIPVFIENDANCCCWGELAHRREEELKNFIFVFQEYRDDIPDVKSYYMSKVSLGLGLVINGKVYYGKDYSAGEFRTIHWHPKNKNQFSLPDSELDRIQNDKDIFNKVLDELSANLALIINTFNLSHVVLGGFVNSNIEGEADDSHKNAVINTFNKHIERNWTYHRPLDCRVEFTQLGEKMVAYGAGAMLLEKLFSIPNFSCQRVEKRMELDLVDFISKDASLSRRR